MSARFHEWMRARPTHPSTPRPVVLNTWEAVYFAHDLDTLKELADTAAGVGVERFVLDDGWFKGRGTTAPASATGSSTRRCGPDGLTPLIEHVKGRGMQFGLWVEPEMINEDSDLARDHPDWISGPATGRPSSGGTSRCVDLANPAAWQHILDALDAILTENAIDYLKWDQNRDQLELGHDGVATRPRADARRVPALRRAARAGTRTWRSRAAPPAAPGSTSGSSPARTGSGPPTRTTRSSGRRSSAGPSCSCRPSSSAPTSGRRCRTAPAGCTTSASGRSPRCSATSASSGTCGRPTDDDRARLADAIRVYKAQRELIATGRMVRWDSPDPSLQVTGVVAQDGSRALFSVATLATSANEVPVPVRFGGLDPERAYRVELALPLGPHAVNERAAWPGSTRRRCSRGRVLTELGLPMPMLNPEQALLVTLTA